MVNYDAKPYIKCIIQFLCHWMFQIFIKIVFFTRLISDFVNCRPSKLFFIYVLNVHCEKYTVLSSGLKHWYFIKCFIFSLGYTIYNRETVSLDKRYYQIVTEKVHNVYQFTYLCHKQLSCLI